MERKDCGSLHLDMKKENYCNLYLDMERGTIAVFTCPWRMRTVVVSTWTWRTRTKQSPHGHGEGGLMQSLPGHGEWGLWHTSTATCWTSSSVWTISCQFPRRGKYQKISFYIILVCNQLCTYVCFILQNLWQSAVWIEPSWPTSWYKLYMSHYAHGTSCFLYINILLSLNSYKHLYILTGQVCIIARLVFIDFEKQVGLNFMKAVCEWIPPPHPPHCSSH